MFYLHRQTGREELLAADVIVPESSLPHWVDYYFWNRQRAVLERKTRQVDSEDAIHIVVRSAPAQERARLIQQIFRACGRTATVRDNINIGSDGAARMLHCLTIGYGVPDGYLGYADLPADTVVRLDSLEIPFSDVTRIELTDRIFGSDDDCAVRLTFRDGHTERGLWRTRSFQGVAMARSVEGFTADGRLEGIEIQNVARIDLMSPATPGRTGNPDSLR